jgi:hypothetical protein
MEGAFFEAMTRGMGLVPRIDAGAPALLREGFILR